MLLDSQMSCCCCCLLTVYVVDLEQKFDFVVWTLSCELMHSIDELLEGDAPVVIFIEDVKDPFYEKRLEKKKKRKHRYV